MKSIKQWMHEKAVLSEDFDKTAHAMYFGSGSAEVDPDIEIELRPTIRRVVDKFESESPDELLEKIKAVISQTVAGIGGSSLNSRAAARKIGSEGEDVNQTKFANMMGDEKIDVPTDLRSILRAKVERIIDQNEKNGSPVPVKDLEDKMLLVASKLVAGLKSRRISAGDLERGLKSGMEEEPIARESSVVPSFTRWIEENEDAVQGSVSEPQHKQGEKNMDLKAVVEKKMMEIAEELERNGKGSRQDVLAAMKSVIDSAGKDQSQSEPQQNDQGGNGQAPQAAPPADGGQQPAPGGQQPQAPQG